MEKIKLRFAHLVLTILVILCVALFAGCNDSFKEADDDREYIDGTKGLRCEDLPGAVFKTQIVGYTGTDPTVIIPDEMGACDVTEIAPCAFEGNSTITSIDIRANLKAIGDRAFYNCENLKTIYFRGDKYEWEALGDTSYLENVEIIYLVTYHTWGLQYKYKQGGQYALVDSVASGDLEVPPTYNGKPVTVIAKNAFSDTGVEKLVLPESIVTIEEGAFSNCPSLRTVFLHPGITAIQPSTFEGCSKLLEVNIPDTVKTIGENAFKGCDNLNFISLPEGVEHIGTSAFAYCGNLCEINIPSTVKTIEAGAFEGCWKLEKIVLPEGLLHIGASAFEGCTALPEIIIPHSVQTIGEYAFRLCAFPSIHIPKTVIYIGRGAFQGCQQLREITCAHPVKPDTWDENWNSENNTVVWGSE